jgi:hypothetical protein
MNRYYVYAHYRLDGDGTIPFYVGKGSNKRCKSNYRSRYWRDIVNKHGFFVEILIDCMSEEGAFVYEMEAIAKYKALGGCECNFTMGGDGVRVQKRWWNDKISDALKNISRPSGISNKNYRDVITKEELVDLYVNKGMSSIDIAKVKGISYATICSRLRQFGIKTRKPSRQPIRVYCINNNTVYDSLSHAAKDLGLFRENIKKVLEGKYSQTGGYSFKKI